MKASPTRRIRDIKQSRKMKESPTRSIRDIEQSRKMTASPTRSIRDIEQSRKMTLSPSQSIRDIVLMYVPDANISMADWWEQLTYAEADLDKIASHDPYMMKLKDGMLKLVKSDRAETVNRYVSDLKIGKKRRDDVISNLLPLLNSIVNICDDELKDELSCIIDDLSGEAIAAAKSGKCVEDPYIAPVEVPKKSDLQMIDNDVEEEYIPFRDDITQGNQLLSSKEWLKPTCLKRMCETLPEEEKRIKVESDNLDAIKDRRGNERDEKFRTKYDSRFIARDDEVESVDDTYNEHMRLMGEMYREVYGSGDRECLADQQLIKALKEDLEDIDFRYKMKKITWKRERDTLESEIETLKNAGNLHAAKKKQHRVDDIETYLENKKAFRQYMKRTLKKQLAIAKAESKKFKKARPHPK
jgi:hypothetical protein